VVGKAALGQFFSEYFGVPCQSFHRLLLLLLIIIIRGWYNGAVVASVTVDSVSPHPKKLN
jgi:hypothetical protein